LKLRLSGSLEIIQGLLDSCGHRLFTFTDPHSRIKVFFVGFVFTVGVADLGRDVILLLDHVIPYASAISVLQIGIEIDLDNTESNGCAVFFFGAAAATVENKEAEVSRD
jgi:hypothetical protein